MRRSVDCNRFLTVIGKLANKNLEDNCVSRTGDVQGLIKWENTLAPVPFTGHILLQRENIPPSF